MFYSIHLKPVCHAPCNTATTSHINLQFTGLGVGWSAAVVIAWLLLWHDNTRSPCDTAALAAPKQCERTLHTSAVGSTWQCEGHHHHLSVRILLEWPGHVIWSTGVGWGACSYIISSSSIKRCSSVWKLSNEVAIRFNHMNEYISSIVKSPPIVLKHKLLGVPYIRIR